MLEKRTETSGIEPPSVTSTRLGLYGTHFYAKSGGLQKEEADRVELENSMQLGPGP